MWQSHCTASQDMTPISPLSSCCGAPVAGLASGPASPPHIIHQHGIRGCACFRSPPLKLGRVSQNALRSCAKSLVWSVHTPWYRGYCVPANGAGAKAAVVCPSCESIVAKEVQESHSVASVVLHAMTGLVAGIMSQHYLSHAHGPAAWDVF